MKVLLIGSGGRAECHSGWDIRFDTIRTFSVDEKLNIRDQIAGGIITEGDSI